MNPGFNSGDTARPDTCNGAAQNTIFARSRRDNETIITYLERLCDEHNALVAQE